MSTFPVRNFFSKFWILALISVFTFSSFPALGQNGSLAKYKRFEKETVYINKLDKNGAVYCEEVKSDDASLNNSVAVSNLHILPSLNDQKSLRGLKIILRATDQLMQYPDAILAFRRAAARWERVITTPITTVLDVDYGPTRFGVAFSAGVLGSTSTTAYYAFKAPNTYALVPDIVQRLKDLKPGNVQLSDLYNAIPIPTPSTVPANLEKSIGTLINLQGLGFVDANISADPNVNPFGSVPAIGFNSGFPFDLDPSNGITASQYDFDAVCTHEIGHALGFVTAAGFADHTGIEDLYYPWDLFRVRPEAVEPGSLTGFSTAPRVTTAGPPNSVVWATEGGTTYFYSTHVFFDGLAKVELSTATGTRLNGDGQQSSHWRDDALRPPSLVANRWIGIMDPTLASGTRLQINNQDLRLLEVIGYGIDYNFKYASMRILNGQDTLDLDNRTDTLKFGNVDLNSQKQIQLQFTNLSLDNPLLYEFEFILNDIQPADASVTFTADTGSVAVGQSSAVNITISNANKPGSFFGTLRIHTNDVNKLVVDVPFELNTGGATAPKINSSPNILGNFSFATKEEIGPKIKTITLSNLGNIPLHYRILTALSAKSSKPTGLLKRASKSSNLEQFFGSQASIATIIYTNDFESGFGGFTQVSDAPHGWQRTILGPATLDGHSKPTVVHFGKEVNGQPVYDSLVTGTLYSPKFDFSKVLPQDVVSISFNYFNKSEVGFDFVYFLVSLDNGKTWSQLASSNSGIIKEQSTAWETVLLQFPDLSGNADSVQFAFQFNSDQLVVDQGFFVDDFEIATLPGMNSIYTSVRGGELTSQSPSKDVDVTINGSVLSPGFYSGGISIISNDYKNSNLTIPFTVNYVLLNKAVKGTLYASTGRGSGSAGKVIKLNTQTGEGSDVGLSGFTTIKSISLNPKTNELFAFNYSLGTPTYVVKVDGETGFGLYQFKAPVTLSAMTFDLTSGNLIGVASTQRVYSFDLATGDTTYLVTSKIKVAALATEPSTEEVWVSIDAASNKDRLYKINKTTGDTTFVGNAGIGNNIIRALAFDTQGNLWGAYGEENAVSSLIKINKTTGAATVVGTTNYRGVFGLAFAPDSITAVRPEQIKPSSFALFNNYPNPFNPSTVISYQLPENSFVSLKVYDVIGNEVVTLVNELQTAGVKNVTFKLKDKELGSGIYFYQLKAGNFVQTKKMLLLK
ncbi:MAG: T9SS type A sorting domain-containing protein [Ignavibacteriaceae bacterium]|nr:T9SS type A sorting domain-containing protein [Ignavibacteriaceae bacterium]